MSVHTVLYFFPLPFPSPLCRILKVTSRHLLSQGPDFSVQFSCTVVSDSLRPLCTASCQTSLSITNSQSLCKLMAIESVMPSNNLILHRPLLLPPSIFPSIRVFSNESVLPIRWPRSWEFQLQLQFFQ